MLEILRRAIPENEPRAFKKVARIISMKLCFVYSVNTFGTDAVTSQQSSCATLALLFVFEIAHQRIERPVQGLLHDFRCRDAGLHG